MAKSITLERFRKQYPELKGLPRNFPLTAHPTARWCKKIGGRLYFFGRIEHWEAALAEYNRVLPEIQAGKAPAVRSRVPKAGLTVADVCNAFLTWQEAQVAAGELTQRSFTDYREVCMEVVSVLGRSFPVAELQQADYVRIRERLSLSQHAAKRRKGVTVSAVTWSNRLQRLRAVINYGLRHGLIPETAKPGDGLKKPKARTLRQEKLAKGPRLFEPTEIRQLLEHASQPMRSMIFLAINAGVGNADLGRMKFSHVDLGKQWLNFPREKTAMPREAALWAETVESLQESLSTRRKPKLPEWKDLFFITKPGHPWHIEASRSTTITHEFEKLKKRAGLTTREGFYTLRRMFQTVSANATGDMAGVRFVMGHTAPASDMSAIYQQNISRERLLRISESVHAWLFQ